MAKVLPIVSGCIALLGVLLGAQNVEATVPPYCAPTPTTKPTLNPVKTPTPTSTSTRPPTRTPTPTRTVTPTRTATVTPTLTPWRAATPRPTKTPVCAPTATYSPTSIFTPTRTATPASSAVTTPDPVHTPTPLPTNTVIVPATPIQTAVSITPTIAPTVTPYPPTSSPTVTVTTEPSPTFYMPVISTHTPTPRNDGTGTPTAYLTGTPGATAVPTSTTTTSITLSPTPEFVASPTVESTIAVVPIKPELELTPIGDPVCSDTASLHFECKTSDQEASITWSNSGDCFIGEIDGPRGEKAKVIVTRGDAPSACEIVCTSYNTQTLLEFSVEKKVLGCELCPSEWNECQTCGDTTDSCSNKDRCGICGGDGTSCEVCSTVDSRPQQVAVDSAALNYKKFLESLISKASNLQRRGKVKGVTLKMVKNWRNLASPLYASIWGDVWGGYQGTSRICEIQGIASECISLSNDEVMTRMKTSAHTMQSLGLTIARTLKKGGIKGTVVGALIRRNDALHVGLLKELAGLPRGIQSCWAPQEVKRECK